MSENISRISIQVGLSGYSFRIESQGKVSSSEWMSAERVFTTPELQNVYDDVALSVFTPKCTLIPQQFHSEDTERGMLEEVAEIGPADPVFSVGLPEFSACLVYSDVVEGMLPKIMSETVRRSDGGKVVPMPELYYMLRQLSSLTDYNKILASYAEGHLFLVIAQGRTLLLCNSFPAQDFTTAEYFIFLALKKLQLNPEVSTICFRTPLSEDEEMSLYRYFRNVEQI